MGMKRQRMIGCSSFALRWHTAAGMTAAEVITTAAGYGAQVVQLCENVNLAGFSRDELRELRKTAEQANIALEVGINGGDRSSLIQGIETSKLLGAEILRAVVDGYGGTLQSIGGEIRDVLPELEQSDITLCLENHFRISPLELRRLILSLQSRHVAACIDPLNSINLFVGPEEVYRLLAPLAKTAHVKDADISRNGTGFEIQGRKLGEGIIDFALFERYLPDDITSILLEGWMEQRSEMEETLREELEWLEAGLSFARRIFR